MYNIIIGRVAQGLERNSYKVEVDGSIPSTPTKKARVSPQNILQQYPPRKPSSIYESVDTVWRLLINVAAAQANVQIPATPTGITSPSAGWPSIACHRQNTPKGMLVRVKAVLISEGTSFPRKINQTPPAITIRIPHSPKLLPVGLIPSMSPVISSMI